MRNPSEPPPADAATMCYRERISGQTTAARTGRTPRRTGRVAREVLPILGPDAAGRNGSPAMVDCG